VSEPKIETRWGSLGALVLFAATSACGGAGGGGSEPTSRDLASVAVSAVDAARESDPGRFAADYLRATHFRSIVVEVDYPLGRPPCADALDLLARRLAERCDKPGGVTVVLDDEIPAAAFPPVLGHDGLRALEDAWRDGYASRAAGEAVVYVLCVAGQSDRDTKTENVVGLSFGGSSLALFLDAADRGSDPFATTAEMQASILVHESAHLLGLVNNGVPMVVDHEDHDENHHCAEPDCIMGHQVVVDRRGPNLEDDDFAPLCPHCVEDLRAFGGR
jgi:hypothetical protein